MINGLYNYIIIKELECLINIAEAFGGFLNEIKMINEQSIVAPTSDNYIDSMIFLAYDIKTKSVSLTIGSLNSLCVDVDKKSTSSDVIHSIISEYCLNVKSIKQSHLDFIGNINMNLLNRALNDLRKL